MMYIFGFALQGEDTNETKHVFMVLLCSLGFRVASKYLFQPVNLNCTDC